ncbi:MAG: LPS assembly protein LptD [Planctomycetes bacterium]|nr:LPS assembly protein LptD [Planctomycetota bacterium]
MTRTRPILLCLLLTACSAGALLAQDKPADGDEPGEVAISFVVDEDQTTFWEAWREVRADGTEGPFVLALPYAVSLTYQDKTPDKGEIRKLTLLADRALLWFEPGEGTDDSDVESDPFLAMTRGARNLQFYGEGNIWMKYTVGASSVTMRADRLFLDFARSKIVSYDANGNDNSREVLNLRGRVSNAKLHSGAEDSGKGPGGPPLKSGIGVGSASDEAAGTEDTVGAAPSDDAKPDKPDKLRSLPHEQGLRLFARADELRFMLGEDLKEVDLENGSVSSSSLAIASYSLAAEKLTIRLTKVRSTVYLTRPSVRVLDYPLLTLPTEDYAYDVDSQPPIRQLDFITNARFGYAFRLYIDAIATYDFFADPEPPFNPLRLGPQIDYFSRRGLGLGLNLDWGGVRSFKEFGASSFRSLYINDPGDKRSRAKDLGWYPVEKHSRGRIYGAYSQNFGDGWQFDHLLNYSSDKNFRREFYVNEYDNNEPENSFLQLTKRYENLNFFLLVEPKVHPWQSRTEYLPTLGFETYRQAVGDFGLQFSSRTDASVLRFKPGDGDDRDEISTLRADSTSWFSLPVELGPFALDPFAGTRFTVATNHLRFADDQSRPFLSSDGTFPGLRPGDEKADGLLYRFLPFFGANLQTFFTGTFSDVQIPGLAIDGLRHVFAPFVRYTNYFYNSLDDIPGRAFTPLDTVDTLDEFHEVRFGFRERLQTRKGWGADRHTVDYFEVMAEIPWYPNRRRDNNDRNFGDLEIAATWRPAPGFTLEGNMFIDPYSGNFNRAAASFRFDVLILGQTGITANIYYRLLKAQHQVVGIQGNLTTGLYGIGVKQEYDLQAGKFRDTRIELTRRVLEAFDLGFVFVRDALDGSLGFYFSISATFRAPSSSASLLR